MSRFLKQIALQTRLRSAYTQVNTYEKRIFMLGTLVSLVLAALLWISPYELGESFPAIRTILIIAALLLLFFAPIAMIFAWSPLQKAEQNSAPRVLEMFTKDRHMGLICAWLLIFPLTTLVISSDFIYEKAVTQRWFFPLWIVFFGVAVDATYHFVYKVFSYLNPFDVAKMFSRQAKISIQNDRELDLCDWIDSLSEVAIKGIQRYSTSISHLALDEQQKLARLFLGASKSIGHLEEDSQMKSAGIGDKVSYTMFYLYQRLDITFNKALQNKLEPTCSLIVTLLGKIAIDAAKFDMSLASTPLRFLGKCAKRAQDEGFEETVITASCVFLEVAKTILSEVDITYYEIKDTFLSIINGMEVLSKEAFRRDKTINIALLMQPFKELRELFMSDKVKNHQDTPVIVQNIDRVLGEFEALISVMNVMPAIPKFEEGKSP